MPTAADGGGGGLKGPERFNADPAPPRAAGPPGVPKRLLSPRGQGANPREGSRGLIYL